MYGVLYAKSSASDKKFVPSVTVKFDKTRMKFAAGNLDDFMPKKGEVVISESYVKKWDSVMQNQQLGKRLH